MAMVRVAFIGTIFKLANGAKRKRVKEYGHKPDDPLLAIFALAWRRIRTCM